MNLTRSELAGYFDHTLLDNLALAADIDRLCDEAVRYGFCTVCVQPRWVARCADRLHATDVKVCSVAGFPFGTDSPAIKARQAEDVILAGADEVDMVADLASVLSGDEAYLRRDMAAVRTVCRSMKPAVTLKVIIESAALTAEQIHFVCGLCQAVGVDFIKTSTGFLKAGGAAVDDVRLMVDAAPQCRIKAAGGIKTLVQAMDFIDAGVSRIGSSAAVAILDEWTTRHDVP